jgi:hypothetical protein
LIQVRKGKIKATVAVMKSEISKNGRRPDLRAREWTERWLAQHPARFLSGENKSREKPMWDVSGKTRNLFGAQAVEKSLCAWAPQTGLHRLANQSDSCLWLGHGWSRREMEKSHARLTDEAENERRKPSRDTRVAIGPVHDAISMENEEQIAVADLERRSKPSG